MRALLRKLIGWDELDTRFISAESAKATETELATEIERLRNQLSLKKRIVPSPYTPQTWEEIQAAYAANPEHFKEQS